MKTHAYVLQLDGRWFTGFSGIPDASGKPRINCDGDVSRARSFNSATHAEAAMVKLAARGQAPTLYVLRAFPVGVADSKAVDAAQGRAARALAKAQA